MTDRVSHLRQWMQTQSLEAVYISRPENVRYLTGFTGSYGFALVSQQRAVLLTDYRYALQAREQCPDFEVLEREPTLPAAVAAQLKSFGIQTAGFEQDHLTYHAAQDYLRLQDSVPGLRWVPTSGAVESLRMIKDAQEIRQLRRAAEIADAAFEHILSVLRPGRTERDIAWEMESFMRGLGATGAGFELIVASGARAAMPHGVASDKVLEWGDLVTLDFGALYEGYRSDITRTVVLGPSTERQRDIYQTVLEAERAAIAAVRPGTTGQAVNDAALAYGRAHGYDNVCGNGLGHGIGLDIHEDPFLSPTCELVLKQGMIFTIEPGIYVTGWGGVRIEDDVLVTDHGCEILTKSPKDELLSIRV